MKSAKSMFKARNSLAAVMMGSALLLPCAAWSAPEAIQQSGSVYFISGGVGDESLDRLKSDAADFNLKLVFALTSGAFMSDVNVAILDKSGNTLLNTTSKGPWLLAKLPAGAYQVVASASGKPMKREVSVDAGKLKTLDFRWTSE
jgi:hypothetical protein